MKILNVVQGSDDWAIVRARHFTASEAPVMMGTSPKATRNDLLRMKATGDEQEFSRWVKEVLFERGHEIEALARPIAEKIIADELFPVAGTDDDGYLLASFDGITLLGDAIWECKQSNAEKAAAVAAGECPAEDYWQVVQQLAVSGATVCLYMVTDGTEQGTLYTWVKPNEKDRQALLAGWAQFAADLADYQPPEVKPEAVGRAPEHLPALHVEVQGMVTASNLAEFRTHALAVFAGINTELQTDEHFADAEKTVRWCKDVEIRLEAAKDHALSQTASIDELFRAIDSIKEEARAKRLELDKLVKTRKQAIRDEILANAKAALSKHINQLEKSLGDGGTPIRFPAVTVDFAGAMRGKKTVKSLQDSTDAELARAKIEASQIAEGLRANLQRFRELAANHRSLFHDLPNLLQKQSDDFEAVVKSRIAEHEAAEEKRREAERERIRAEERQRAERIEREARQAEERQRAEDERKQREAEEDVRRAKAQEEMAVEVTAPSAEREQEAPGEAPFDDEDPFEPEPSPAPSQYKASGDRAEWIVTATFEISAPAGVSRNEIATELHRVLAKAGITTLRLVDVMRKTQGNAA